MNLEQMIHHCQAVKRGAPNRPLLVGDMPLGTYEFDNVDIALKNAYRMVKDGGMDAVKLEVPYISFFEKNVVTLEFIHQTKSSN